MASRAHGRDLTVGPIAPTLLAFALPTLISSILQSLNGTINAIWVGRFLGENALAATSNANMIMFLLMAFVFGFGMAATVLVGQAFGRKDVDGARQVIGTAIGFFLFVAVVIAILGWTFSPALLGMDSGRRLCSISPSGPSSRYRRSHLCPVCREIPNSRHRSVTLLPVTDARSTNCSFKLMARCSFQGIHPLNTVSDVLTLWCQRCPGTAPEAQQP